MATHLESRGKRKQKVKPKSPFNERRVYNIGIEVMWGATKLPVHLLSLGDLLKIAARSNKFQLICA